MPGKHKHRPAPAPAPATFVVPIQLQDEPKKGRASDDHNPRTNPAMHDGNSSHGSPYDTAVDEITTDNDTGDV